MVWAFALAAIGFAVSPIRHAIHPQPEVLDLGEVSRANSFPKGQCTWYAFERALDAGNRIRFKQSYGRDAKSWPTLAVTSRMTQTPTPGSIMVLDAWDGNPFGHVAYVESVQSPKAWTISHANMKVGEEFAKLSGITIRKAKCTKQPDGTMVFDGYTTHFHLAGFLVSG